MFPWKQEVYRSEMHVLNLTNIYEVYISHNCQTVTMNKRKCNTTISLPISVKHIIRGPYGGLSLVILRAQGGQKFRFFLQKVKAFLQIKIKLYQICFEMSYLHYTIVVKEYKRFEISLGAP